MTYNNSNNADTNINMFSFDIFDTIVTRVTAEPSGIFLIIENIINTYAEFEDIPGEFIKNYLNMRLSAESYLHTFRCQNECEEVTLYEIYALICSNYGLSNKQLDKLMKLEIQVEIDSSIAIYENIETIKKLVNYGSRVILISDTYLPLEAIMGILLKHDPIFLNIPIYLSSEIKFRKSTGNLYKYIQKVEHLNYNCWKHTGDNKKSDDKIPKRLGINTNKYAFPTFTKSELQILHYGKPRINVQLIVGLSRNTRLSTNEYSIEKSLGYLYGLPVLYSYIVWIINTSINNDIEDLYFLARDGYILKIICDTVLKNDENQKLHTHYLYGSRDSLRFDDKYNPINGHPASSEHTDQLQKALTLKKIRAKKYLLQELKTNFNKIAIVDLAGTGKTMESIAKLLDMDDEKLLQAFYLFYLPNKNETNFKRYVYSINNATIDEIVVELLVRAPHGKTIDYCEKSGKFIPFLEEKEGKMLEKWGYGNYIQGVKESVFSYSILCKKYNLDVVSDSLLLSYGQMFDSPDREMLKLLSSIPFTDNDDLLGMEFAPPLTLISLIFDFLIHKKITKTSYIPYSLLLGDPFIYGINYVLAKKGTCVYRELRRCLSWFNKKWQPARTQDKL